MTDRPGRVLDVAAKDEQVSPPAEQVTSEQALTELTENRSVDEAEKSISGVQLG